MKSNMKQIIMDGKIRKKIKAKNYLEFYKQQLKEYELNLIN